MEVYLFYRVIKNKPFFYPIELRDDEDAVANAIVNPGTTKVTKYDGTPVWTQPQGEAK